ncbi:ATP-binding protein [Halogeometricum limi]|uniref:AAA+-type ATPase, SpoVK/Ycf46/Vps4 family n=1 Tax=Halogeometricum limi TaxID=555875 RepID=A0A1I6IER7_9EURY|nr:ATP-binding protein [Halogeometricum limi]SFR65134.1 AAA+-type ATPase, SpoVK/Ycf46/Vps4 family [Halogeometricum limi]
MTAVAPYEDDASYLLDELELFDRLLERRLLTWWSETEAENEFSGLYISDAEVWNLLGASLDGSERRSANRGGDGESVRGGRDVRDDGRERSTDGGERFDAVESVPADAAAETQFFDVADTFRRFDARVTAASRRIRRRKRLTRDAGRTLRFDRLCETFGLETRHREALLVALGPELDPKYGRIYAYLHDDVTRTTPTVGLVVRLFASDRRDRIRYRTAFTDRSVLRRSRLLTVDDSGGEPLPNATVRVEERVVEYLLGGDELGGRLADVVDASAAASLDAVPVDDGGRRRLERLVDVLARRTERGEHAFVHLYGPEGVGKAAGVAAVCSAVGRAHLLASLEDVPATEWVERCELLVREARLRDAALAVDIGSVDERDENGEQTLSVVRGLVERLDELGAHVFLLNADGLPQRVFRGVERHVVSTVELPRTGFQQRRRSWEAVPDLPADADATYLASTFRFTPGEIADAVETARRLDDGDSLTAETLSRGCRVQARRNLGSLARRVEPRYTWDDIVLPEGRLDQLHEVAARIRRRGEVLTEWGFEEKFSLGNGLTVLFSGPSGTGKTMATEILASDAGLDLYKVELASVVSKYIGETEKNLKRVFDEAEGSDAILLFDEADALFGKRSEVTDARDRYANIEVNYLLQRIEEHGGIVVLTTNLRENFDDAFERRIHACVDFPLPDERSRAEIWRRVFPDQTPTTDLDVPFLAGLELSGGSIKNVALNAAFLAAEEGTSVETSHVVRATRREYQKMGRMFSVDEFGVYASCLRS